MESYTLLENINNSLVLFNYQGRFNGLWKGQQTGGKMRRAWSWFKNLFRRKRRKPYAPIQPIRLDGKVISIDVHGTVNFTEDQKQFFLESMKLKTYVLSSVEFQKRFFALKCTETNGKSMKEVYLELMSGRDKYGNQEDYDIDLFVTLYGHSSIRSNTIGYTYPNTFKIWTHRYHFTKWMNARDRYGRAIGKASLAGHLFHEYFHNVGYGHKKYPIRDSLVYKAGYLMTAMAKEVLEGAVLLPVEFTPSEN